jgi:hypothetical protein
MEAMSTTRTAGKYACQMDVDVAVAYSRRSSEELLAISLHLDIIAVVYK